MLIIIYNNYSDISIMSCDEKTAEFILYQFELIFAAKEYFSRLRG